MNNNQNPAIAWLIYLSRQIQFGYAKFDKLNPKVLLFNAKGSAFFLCGRDANMDPYFGIPSSMMPFFTQMDWMDVSIDRESGYLFLEAKDPRTGMLNIALGFKSRLSRLDVICLAGKEDPNTMRLSIKVFEQSKVNPKEVVYEDRSVMTGLPIRFINSTADIGSVADAEYARDVLGRSGVDSAFTIKTIDV